MKRKFIVLTLSGMIVTQQALAPSLALANTNNNIGIEIYDTNTVIEQVSGGVRFLLKDGILTVLKDTDGGMGDDINSLLSNYKDQITKVIIEYGVTSISQGAFNGLAALTYAEIPNSVTSIGDGAFSNCPNLTDIAIPEKASFGNGVFENSSSVHAKVYYGSSAHQVLIQEGNVSYSFLSFQLPYVTADYKFDHTLGKDFNVTFTKGSASMVELKSIAVDGVEANYIQSSNSISIPSNEFDKSKDIAKIEFNFEITHNGLTIRSTDIIYVYVTTLDTPEISEVFEMCVFYDESDSDVYIPIEMKGTELTKIQFNDVVLGKADYSIKENAVVLNKSYVKSLSDSYYEFILHFNEGTQHKFYLIKEGSFDNSSQAAILNSHVEFNSKDDVVVMKYTSGIDNATVQNILVNGKNPETNTRSASNIYTVNENDKTITVSSEFIKTLDNGYHMFGVEFSDGTISNAVTVLKEEVSVDVTPSPTPIVTPSPVPTIAPTPEPPTVTPTPEASPTPSPVVTPQPTPDVTPPVIVPPSSAPVVPPIVIPPVIVPSAPSVSTPVETPTTNPEETEKETENKEEEKEEELKLGKTYITLYTKGSTTSNITTNKDGDKEKISYSSSNRDVVRVNTSGKVRGLKAGKAIITVTVGDMTAQCTIVVKEPALRVSATELTVAVGKGKKLWARTGPEGTITFKSSNPKVATISKYGYIRGKNVGTATITVECHGIKKTVKVTVKK